VPVTNEGSHEGLNSSQYQTKPTWSLGFRLVSKNDRFKRQALEAIAEPARVY